MTHVSFLWMTYEETHEQVSFIEFILICMSLKAMKNWLLSQNDDWALNFDFHIYLLHIKEKEKT